MEIEGIKMASAEDIAAMKLSAIVGSGHRVKDFIDIYASLEHIPLLSMVEAFEFKYSPNVNRQMAFQALLYYEDLKTKSGLVYKDQQLEWPHIAERLKQAVANPQQVFTNIQRKQRGNQRRQIRQDKNKGKPL